MLTNLATHTFFCTDGAPKKRQVKAVLIDGIIDLCVFSPSLLIYKLLSLFLLFVRARFFGSQGSHIDYSSFES